MFHKSSHISFVQEEELRNKSQSLRPSSQDHLRGKVPVVPVENSRLKQVQRDAVNNFVSKVKQLRNTVKLKYMYIIAEIIISLQNHQLCHLSNIHFGCYNM